MGKFEEQHQWVSSKRTITDFVFDFTLLSYLSHCWCLILFKLFCPFIRLVSPLIYYVFHILFLTHRKSLNSSLTSITAVTSSTTDVDYSPHAYVAHFSIVTIACARHRSSLVDPSSLLFSLISDLTHFWRHSLLTSLTSDVFHFWRHSLMTTLTPDVSLMKPITSEVTHFWFHSDFTHL